MKTCAGVLTFLVCSMLALPMHALAEPLKKCPTTHVEPGSDSAGTKQLCSNSHSLEKLADEALIEQILETPPGTEQSLGGQMRSATEMFDDGVPTQLQSLNSLAPVAQVPAPGVLPLLLIGGLAFVAGKRKSLKTQRP
jgi:hypothetical protein